MLNNKIGVFSTLTFSVFPFQVQADSPEIMLATDYLQQANISQFLISEKLDGVRAYWTGDKLISRSGNQIMAPKWFTQSLPDFELEGELWIGRGQFSRLLSTVRDQQPNELEWRKVGFYLFDIPNNVQPFEKRYQTLKALTRELNSPHIRAIPQFKVSNQKQLDEKIKWISDSGAEGLMLHHKDNHYLPGRSHQVMKLKLHQDDEALVIDHVAGKGKYTDMMGAIVVETKDGKQFKIGSGFSDAERASPPPIGSVVTFRYNGTTENGIPRFARFLRVHPML